MEEGLTNLGRWACNVKSDDSTANVNPRISLWLAYVYLDWYVFEVLALFRDS